ncbi:MAG TPA: hypothetical protein VMC83_19455 [Streptosporangiaceae bacterium]|nr:hypothetical protein [Streptosporangiaceae bacterium]
MFPQYDWGYPAVLKDIRATLHPVLPTLAAIDIQMTEALDDTQ